ncbi:MAG: TolC family protein [Caldimicrobium sp.]
MKKIGFLSIFFIFLAFSSQALAKKVLTLSEAVSLAIKANPQISSALKQREEFFYQKNIIRAEFFPKIFLNYTYQRTDLGKNLPEYNTHLFGPFLTWNIFSGFSTYYAFKEALYYLALQDENLRGKINEIALTTIKTYLDYFKEKSLLEAALSDLEDAKNILKLAKKRYEVGLSPYADVLDAEARLKEAEYKVTNYKYLSEISKAKLLILLNEDLTKIEEYELLPIEEKDLTLKALPEYIAKALKLRPEILSKEKEILAQESRLKSVRGEFFPSIDLFANYYKEDSKFFPDSNFQFQAGIKITFPLFTGFSTVSKLQKERATLEKKHFERRELELNIQHEVFSNYKIFETSRENLAASLALLAKLEEDYRIMQKKYENGLASIVDLTTVMARLSEARSNVALSKYDLIFNYYNLLKSTGEIPGL